MFNVRCSAPSARSSFLASSLRTHAGRSTRGGFSLLEVLLALAILTVALAACLQLVYVGMRHAREARDLTRAQEICESVLGLITSGVLDVNSVQGEQQAVADIWAAAGIAGSVDGDFDLQAEEEDWLCSIVAVSGGVPDAPDLLRVTVTVTEAAATETPAEFTLVRWLIDPAYWQSVEPATSTGAP